MVEIALTIRQLTAADLPTALGLSEQAGWNQLEADWRRMLELEPGGCLAAERDGRLVGTTVCCTFGPVAWLAMVLVEESLRGQGIGRRLVEAGLDFADRAGAKTVRLDATPLGRPVYERAGFVPQFELIRWSGRPLADELSRPGGLWIARSSAAAVHDELLALDRRSTGTDRAKLLRHLFATAPPSVARSPDGRIVGFLADRPGRLATQLGPCCGTEDAALALLQDALRDLGGESVIVDVPTDSVEVPALLQQAGLSVQRQLLRMCRGEPVCEDRDWFRCSYSPELG